MELTICCGWCVLLRLLIVIIIAGVAIHFSCGCTQNRMPSLAYKIDKFNRCEVVRITRSNNSRRGLAHHDNNSEWIILHFNEESRKYRREIPNDKRSRNTYGNVHFTVSTIKTKAVAASIYLSVCLPVSRYVSRFFSFTRSLLLLLFWSLFVSRVREDRGSNSYERFATL